ncbi:MAG: TRAP transporter substrate-binding protein DctP [Pseudomonadota bacterium]|nr:TRAP transporter substrate-binding protein DctP [Pseudomonadota bacterium]
MNYFKGAALAWLLLITSLSLPARATVFKIASIAPEGSQLMREMRSSADEIKKLTAGRVTIKYYGGGVMGNDRKVLQKIRSGQLQGGALAASGVGDPYPDINLYGLPLLFRSQNEVDFLRGKLDKELLKGLDEAGFISFGFADGGFALLMGGKPASRIDDLRGQKAWAPEADQLSYLAMESMQLSPVVLPIAAVLTGLQTGQLDIVATPPVGALWLQWYTKVKYVTDLPLVYTMGLMVVDKREYAKISAVDQAIFRKVMEATYQRLDRMGRKANARAKLALRANGLHFVKPEAAAVSVWQKKMAASNRRIWRDGNYTPDLLPRALALLDEYRLKPTPSRETSRPGDAAQ